MVAFVSALIFASLERPDKDFVHQKVGIGGTKGGNNEQRNSRFDIHAFVRVRIDSSKHYKSFMEHVMKEDEIMECFSVTGSETAITPTLSTPSSDSSSFQNASLS